MPKENNIGREHTFIFSHWVTLSKPLSWPPARKSNNLQKFYYLCASRAIWPLQGKSFSITHPMLHVSSFIHSINIYWAPTGKLAERQCLVLNEQERRSHDPSDSISVMQWRNPEEYSLWCPLLLWLSSLCWKGYYPRTGFLGFSIQLFISIPASSRWEGRLYQTQWSADYTGAYRLVWPPVWLEVPEWSQEAQPR